MIRLFHKGDIARIASMHAIELSGFLPELGEEFLRLFYEKSMDVPEMFTFVAVEKSESRGTNHEVRKKGKKETETNKEKGEETIVGFVTGVTSARGLYKKILLKDPIRFGMLLLGYILTHPNRLITIVQTLMYPGFESDESELLTLAVDKNYRMRGIGRKNK